MRVTVRVIDAHVHVWSQDLLRYPFGPHDGLTAPTEARTAEDFLADAADADVREVLLIQPRVYGYDHAYLFDAAAGLSGHARVMPMVNVTRPQSADELRRLATHERTAAFRVVALGAPPANWLCSPEAHQLWEAAAQLDLPVGMLVDPHQLPLVAQVAASHPDLTVVVDHMGRCIPTLAPEFAPYLFGLAAHPNVHVKISAVDSLSTAEFPHPDMWALIAGVYREFGASRLLWGSDWPHVRLPGTYGLSCTAIGQALAGTSERDFDAIFSTTARRLFGLGSCQRRIDGNA